MTYPIAQVPGTAQQLEQLGTKQKFWFQGEDERLWLFKYARPNTGEDWAEKVAAELCRQLGLPHAEYHLAECGGRRGVVTPTFAPYGSALVFGNELLSYVVAQYDIAPQYHRVHHTVGRVFRMLNSQQVRPPHGWDAPLETSTAGAVFVGYLMLDTLIGNSDRHDQNWGVVLRDGDVFLQPTYDHASSLGRLLSEEACAHKLSTKDRQQNVASYVLKARSALFPPGGTKTLLTIDAFKAAAKRERAAATFWLRRLENVSDAALWATVDRVDATRMGPSAKQFTAQMLMLNKRRLLDLL